MRAVELGSCRAVSMAGALLRSVGWEVDKVEPPGGDPLRRRPPLDADGESLLFSALNAGKRSVTCDLATEEGRAGVRALSEGADVVLAADRDAAAIGALASRALVRIADFGRGGPYDGWKASDLTWAALTGLAHATPPGPIRPDELREPLKPGPELYELTTGLAAAAAAAVLTFDPDGTRREVRLNHHVVATPLPILENVSSYLALGEVVGRGSDRMRYAPLALMRCADGFVYVQCHDEITWDRFVQMMGSPDWAADPRFANRYTRFEHWDELEPLLLDWLGVHTKAEIFARCKELALPFAPVQDMADLAASEHLRQRGSFRVVKNASGRELRAPMLPTVVAGLGRGATGRRARRTPARDGWAGALDGVRVLAFSIIWAGPWVTRVLASAGAEVVRVETGVRPELLRVVPPYVTGLPELEAGWLHQVQQRGKRSFALNLKHPRAAGVARRLAAGADVVVQNFRPGVADRLGVGFDALAEANPALVMLSISGYGMSGPDALAGAAGSGVLAYSGATALTGYGPDRPHTLGTSWPDQACGMVGAFCIASALRRADGPVHIDLALNDVMLTLLTEPLMAHLNGAPAPETYRNRTATALISSCFPAAGDDRWLAVTVESEAELGALAELLDVGRDEAEVALQEWSAVRPAAEAAARLQAAGIAAAPVHDGRDVVEDPHLSVRGFWETVRHPAGVDVRVPRHAVVEGHTAAAPAAAVLGGDTSDVCRSWAGMDDDEVSELIGEGVLR
jgi:crotonobetainyl-CoA:carnitine CoA-transferase CaiB-like acyl-CoA transferase